MNHVTPVQTAEPNQLATDDQPVADGSSGDQAIIIPYSPELGPIGRTEPDGAGRSELNKDGSAPTALQVIPPSDQAEEQPSRSKYMRSGLPRPPPARPDDNRLLPPSTRAEAPESGGVDPWGGGGKGYTRRWEPFHRGASTADRLSNLYPHIYLVLVVARGLGLLEDYMMTLPAFTLKEDFPQIIEDGIQVRNRNFVQSTELVR